MVAPLQKRRDIVRSRYYAMVHCDCVNDEGDVVKRDVRVNGRRNSVRAYMEEARRIDMSCIPRSVTVYKQIGIMDVDTFVRCCEKLTRTETHEIPLA